jgi:hypothetical protein
MVATAEPTLTLKPRHRGSCLAECYEVVDRRSNRVGACYPSEGGGYVAVFAKKHPRPSGRGDTPETALIDAEAKAAPPTAA